MAEKRRFPEEFHVDERRPRLKRNRFELVEPVHAIRRVDVERRDSEHPTPGQAGNPASDPAKQSQRPATDGMITAVDGVKQRVKLRGRPARSGVRHDCERPIGCRHRRIDAGPSPMDSVVRRRRFPLLCLDRRAVPRAHSRSRRNPQPSQPRPPTPPHPSSCALRMGVERMDQLLVILGCLSTSGVAETREISTRRRQRDFIMRVLESGHRPRREKDRGGCPCYLASH